MFKKPWANFRKGRFRLAGFMRNVEIVAGWQLTSKIQKLFPVPASVWFARFSGVGKPLPEATTSFEGHLPRRDATPSEAEASLAIAEEPWPSEDTGVGGSDYRSAFRAGALLYPRRLVMVERLRPGRIPENPHAPRVVGRVGKQDKKPWKSIEPPSGPVEVAFVRPSLLGENVFPFRIGCELESVIPVHHGTMLDSVSASNMGATGLSRWLQACEDIWRKHGEGTRTFAEHLDYFAQLTSQFPLATLRMVYAKSGKEPTAAVLENSPATLDHKLYWAEASTPEEARYLVAILNSETARRRVEQWQAKGQWGARDFDKVMFNLPIPVFDASNKLHADLAEAGAHAEEVAALVELRDGEYFVSTRRRIRKALAEEGIAAKIEKLVEKLLGPV